MIKLAVIGTGRIAKRFVKTIKDEKLDMDITSVYNPRLQSAEKFAAENEIGKFTDCLSDLWKEIDAVYIASPHETHYEYAKEALLNKCHVLCEKPMALDEKQVLSLYQLAKQVDCVLLEAIKTAYCPGFLKLLEILDSGVIGEVRDMEATFTRLTPENLREFQNTNYGGSVLEFGSYVLLPILKILGIDYKEVQFQSLFAESGVDKYTKIHFAYENAFATAKVGLGVKSEGELIVSGTKGYIYVPAPWWMTSRLEVRYEDPNKRDVYESEYKGSGLQYEIEAFMKAVNGQDKHNALEQISPTIASIMRMYLENK